MKKLLTYVLITAVSLLMLSCDEQVEWELKYQEADLLVVEGKISSELKQHEVSLSKPLYEMNASPDPVSLSANARIAPRAISRMCSSARSTSNLLLIRWIITYTERCEIKASPPHLRKIPFHCFSIAVSEGSTGRRKLYEATSICRLRHRSQNIDPPHRTYPG